MYMCNCNQIYIAPLQERVTWDTLDLMTENQDRTKWSYDIAGKMYVDHEANVIRC